MLRQNRMPPLYFSVLEAIFASFPPHSDPREPCVLFLLVCLTVLHVDDDEFVSGMVKHETFMWLWALVPLPYIAESNENVFYTRFNTGLSTLL